MTVAHFAFPSVIPSPYPTIKSPLAKRHPERSRAKSKGCRRISSGLALFSTAKFNFARIDPSRQRKREKSFRTSPFSKTSPRSYFFFLAGFLATFLGAFFLVAI
jgi:hypothetical protein